MFLDYLLKSRQIFQLNYTETVSEKCNLKSDNVSQVSGCVSDALKFHKYATNRRAWKTRSHNLVFEFDFMKQESKVNHNKCLLPNSNLDIHKCDLRKAKSGGLEFLGKG